MDQDILDISELLSEDEEAYGLDDFDVDTDTESTSSDEQSSGEEQGGKCQDQSGEENSENSIASSPLSAASFNEHWQNESLSVFQHTTLNNNEDLTDEEHDNNQIPNHSKIKDWKKGVKFSPGNTTFIMQRENRICEGRVTANSTPLEILQYFLYDQVIEDIVIESNRYVSQIKAKNSNSFNIWKDLTTSELWLFFALTLTMGLVRKSSIKDYWCTDILTDTPFFKKMMPRTRYEEILRSLHFVDNEDNPLKATDRYSKLGSFMPRVLEKFKNTVIPKENLCVDESLLLFKGRLSIKQYNPKKRSRFGLKSFVLLDGFTKIVLNIIPYQGLKTKLLYCKRTFGYGGAVVMTLLTDLFGNKHKVFVDNWFNSPTLAAELKQRDTFLLGTVKNNRKFMPKSTTKLGSGDVETFCNGDMLVERWSDRREVRMLNTFMPHSMLSSVSEDARNTRLKPATVLAYNKSMGILDNRDQQLKAFSSIRKTIKWYRKFAFHLIDNAVYNSFQVFKIVNPTTSMVYKEFLKSLIGEIVAKYPVPRKKKGRKSATAHSVARLIGQHLPVLMKTLGGAKKYLDCVYCKLNGKRKSTPFQCQNCDKSLCISDSNSCFSLYHTESCLPAKRSRSRVVLEERSNELDENTFSDF